MSFVDINFILRFVPVFLLVYYLCPARFRNFILCVGSIVFYAFGAWNDVILLLLLSLLNYEFVYSLQTSRDSFGNLVMGVAVGINLSVLLLFKYVFGTLPLGISFYTFMAISTIVDAHKKKIRVDSLMEYLTYIFMFPKILQGPIVPYERIASEMKGRTIALKNVELGLEKFIVGLGFKVLLADRFAILWEKIQSIGFESISTPMAWLGVLVRSAQLYFDFQGYSLMAIGLALMMGFSFDKNFNHPYSSKTVSEFYRRWHISLGKWFRDYLYIPLGGNKKGLVLRLINISIVWAATGIWHGTTLNFMIWAGYLLVLILLEKIVWGAFLNRHVIISKLYIWFFVPLSWIIFSITDPHSLKIYFSRLFLFNLPGISVNATDFIFYGRDFIIVVVAAFFVSLPGLERFAYRHRNSIIAKLLLLVVFLFCVYEIYNGINNPFLYSVF